MGKAKGKSLQRERQKPCGMVKRAWGSREKEEGKGRRRRKRGREEEEGTREKEGGRREGSTACTVGIGAPAGGKSLRVTQSSGGAG